MKFIFLDEGEKCWIVEAPDQHSAIGIAVKAGYSDSMFDFYYGYEDGQIQVVEIQREIMV